MSNWRFLPVFLLMPMLAAAMDVSLVGVVSNKALLSFSGGRPLTLSQGETVQGVRLLSVQGDQAVVEINGKRRPLRVGQNVVGEAAPEARSGTQSSESGGSGGGGDRMTLMADGAGHFFATGTINGVAVRFLVDTGATFISIGRSDAQRIGINVSGGQRAMSQTANGVIEVTKVKLDTVQLGTLILHNVDAVVHNKDLPITLLGMSFLNRMEMQRLGSNMTLKKRF